MKIGFDFDDVLADTMEGWCDYWVHKYGYRINKKDIKHWDLNKALEAIPKIKHDIKDPFEPFKQPDFFLNLRPKDGIELFNEYVHRDVYIVTACEYGHLQKREWLKQHVPEFNLDNLIFTKNKSMVKIDILVDDKEENMDNNRKFNVLFDQPWNKENDFYARAYNLKDTLLLLERIDDLIDEVKDETYELSRDW